MPEIRRKNAIGYRSWYVAGVLAACFLMGCSTSPVEQTDDGVVIQLAGARDTDAKLLKVQVVADGIIRVVAAPGDAFSDRASLIVEQTAWEPVAWTMEETDTGVAVATPKVTVRVNRSTGAVAFYDADGSLILQEKAEGGKVITPVEVLGEQTFSIRQVFESPDDEAFYGLGQHQNDVMNYKGHDVDLWQDNMVASVPFLVSSKPYGILWDNTSHTRFGDIREYQPLSSLKLIDGDGNEGGFTVAYFNDPNFEDLLVAQTEQEIEHQHVNDVGVYPEGFDRNGGSIRWTGAIEAEESGTYKLRLYASEYVRVWLDGEQVLDAWRQNWLPWTHYFEVPLQAGEQVDVRIEWIPNGGFIGLRALPPDPQEDAEHLSLYSAVGDQIDYYFMAGDDLDDVIAGYRTVTGQAPMMPKWAMGLWQCRERYETQEQLLDVVRAFRQREIPLDNIVQDWFYWPEDQWGSHDFDPERFPDPEGMVDELHDELNTRIMISVWPKFYVGTAHYEQFREKGWLYMHNIEKGVRDWVGPGYVSTFYDPFSEGARDLFWQQINEKLFSKGFDAWWLDATEPDLESNVTPEERVLRVHPNALGTAARYENAFSLMNARGIYESQRETSPDQRVFILTRSAYAGQQRYAAATWGGDVAARWYDLDAQISAGLNFSLSGIPYWTADIGGFAVEQRYQDARGEDLAEWRELMTRWFQFGTFLPLFRVHGQYPYREMFNVAPDDHPAYQTMLAYDKLRYRLMPYIYSLTGRVTHDDYTIMRALVMDFNDDAQVRDIGDQYMFGPALLVNPVTEYQARSRPVYLPDGTGWYDFDAGTYHEGGRTIDADAPYTTMPIFVRAGSIIPFGPAIQYTGEKPADPVRLHVYAGADGAFALYEDEGVNYNYEDGAFSLIPFTYDDAAQTLTIGAREGSFPGMLETRTFEVVWIDPDTPVGYDMDRAPDATASYDGAEVVINR